MYAEETAIMDKVTCLFALLLLYYLFTFVFGQRVCLVHLWESRFTRQLCCSCFEFTTTLVLH